MELNLCFSTFGERSVDLAQLCALQPTRSGAPDSAAAAEEAQTDTAAAMADEKPKVRSGSCKRLNSRCASRPCAVIVQTTLRKAACETNSPTFAKITEKARTGATALASKLASEVSIVS